MAGRLDAPPHLLKNPVAGHQPAFANAQMLAREKQDRLTEPGSESTPPQPSRAKMDG